MNIPRIIHLTSKDRFISSVYKPYFQKIRGLHPDWQINIYDDNDARELIKNHFPFLLLIYDAYPVNVQRADIFRTAVVYLFGGFYMDMDMNCLKSLDSLLGLNLILAEEKNVSVEECERLQLKYQLRIANYMFGSIPKHPFWIDVLKAAFNNSGKAVAVENDILETTGPGLVTNVYHECKHKYKDISILHNIDRKCLRHCTQAPSCHFGDYAAHLHLGSWRWQHKTKVPQIIVPDNKIQALQEETTDHLFNELKGDYQYNKNDLIILETYPSTESPYDGLTGIFSEVKLLGKIVKDTHDINASKVLVCGIATMYGQRVSANNTNIVFTTFESDQLPANWVWSINHCQYCIVPHEEVKKIFENSGVKIPITIIQNGFKRFKRNWNRKLPTPHFTVGFLGIPVSRKNLMQLYDACKELQQTDIPNIKLAVHVATFYDWLDKRQFEKIKNDDMIVWTTGKYNIDQISDWYNSLDCYVFPSSGEGWSYTPRESLYLGIPTILSDIPLHQELLETGFCKAIKTSGKERANFNGSYHGNWAKIETEEIKRAIQDVYERYNYFKGQAKKGAFWIEDKWLNQDIQQQLLDFINVI